MRLGGRLSLGFGLFTAVLMLGIAGARADSKSTFNGTPRATQLAALEASQNGPVAATDLAVERAMGLTPDTLSAPEETTDVAVILWDDAWSGLHRRARSQGAGGSAGSNAGTSISGSSGN
jgi:hypothetical protein